jgi:hypothetical protein
VALGSKSPSVAWRGHPADELSLASGEFLRKRRHKNTECLRHPALRLSPEIVEF